MIEKRSEMIDLVNPKVCNKAAHASLYCEKYVLLFRRRLAALQFHVDLLHPVVKGNLKTT
jgi:hypothetical protein